MLDARIIRLVYVVSLWEVTYIEITWRNDDELRNDVCSQGIGPIINATLKVLY